MLLDFVRGDFDLWEFLTSMIHSLPGILLALSLHEAGHAFVAWRCGDPTARNLGRLTVNPLKHIDPVGFLMMLVVGVGYAKPVPVNPRNFRRGRRDDLLVSMAGIIANLLQMLAGLALIYGFLAMLLRFGPLSMRYGDNLIVTIEGERYLMPPQEAFSYFFNMGEYLITPYLGGVAGYVYDALTAYCVVNFSLAMFNLLPVPPLDGYHILNDLVLKNALFASQRAQNIGRLAVLALVMTGLYSRVASEAINTVFMGAGQAMSALWTMF